MTIDVATTSQTECAQALDAQCCAWIDAMSGGDQKALADFYDATLGRAYSVAMRIIHDAALAEDVVIEAYHDAWRNAASFDVKRGRPITWLLTLCRNRALDVYRRRASAERKTQAATAMAVLPDDEGPDDLLSATEQQHVVHAALAEMEPNDRQLIGLAFFKGFTHQQIATSLDLPLGTVKTRIRRALKLLQARIPREHQQL
ncbi:MAG: RNA polymerase sigma factor [Gammaproteobacteria bacterium]